jgi:hypothetical protein
VFTGSLPGTQTSYFSVLLLGAESIENSFPTYSCHVLKGGTSHRNGSSSVVACIRCRENVYGNAHMSQYSPVESSNVS